MSFMVILVAKLEYNAYQAGVEDVFNAQAGTTFLQDWFTIKLTKLLYFFIYMSRHQNWFRTPLFGPNIQLSFGPKNKTE